MRLSTRKGPQRRGMNLEATTTPASAPSGTELKSPAYAKRHRQVDDGLDPVLPADDVSVTCDEKDSAS